MSSFIVYSAIGQTTDDLWPYLAGGVAFVYVQDPDQFIVRMASGAYVRYVGTDFTYAGDTATGGTYTAIQIITSHTDLTPLAELYNVNAFVAHLADIYTVIGPALVLQGDDGMVGGDGNDTLNGSDGADGFIGEGGDDVIHGGTGGDVIYGGTGNDTLYLEDVLVAGFTQEQAYGGDGNDTIYVATTLSSEHSYYVEGDGTNATSEGTAPGNDTIIVTGQGRVEIYAGGGQDTITNASPNATIIDGGAGNDSITTAATDFIYGGEGNDTIGEDILGGPHAVWIYGDDVAYALTGDDDITVFSSGFSTREVRILAGQGTDTITSTILNVIAFGGAGNDSIAMTSGSAWGGDGADHITRTGDGTAIIEADGDNDLYTAGTAPGNDTVDIDSTGTTTVYGGGGRDTITAIGTGSDFIDGGEGDDIIVIDGAASTNLDIAGGGAGRDTITVRSRGYTEVAAGADGDTIIIEAVVGLGLGAGAVNANGDGGADTIYAYNEFGTVHGGDGDDLIVASIQGVLGGNGSDTIVATYAGTDHGYIYGDLSTSGGDPGNDNITINVPGIFDAYGGAGNDTFLHMAGEGNIHAGEGNDTMTVTASLGGPGGFRAYGGDGSDTITVLGDGHATVYGDDSNGLSVGTAPGNDTITMLGTADLLAIGGDGNDRISGSIGNDVMFGDGDNDTLSGGAGDDYFFGGDGIDTADFSTATNVAGLTITLSSGAATVLDAHASGETDFLNGIENLIGSAFADRLTGDGKDNALWGGAEIDVLSGNAGADTLIGGSFADIMSGGAGDDTFIVAAGDLLLGEEIDGGADFDTLELLAGTHSLIGAVLTDVESITLANSSLTLASAAQAGLVTAATGANDTVIYDGYLDWASQALWLGQHGVENVRFTNGNGTNTVHFNAGVLTSLDIVYNASNTTFQTTTNTYDPSGALLTQYSVYDNSLDELITFAGGVRTTIVRHDLAGGTEFYWSSQSFTYDPTGALTVFEVVNDNGTQQRVEYTGGIRTRDLHTEADGDTYDIIYDASGALMRTISTDVSNSSPGFYSFTNDFSNGHVVKQKTIHDNGTRTLTSYNPLTGLKESYEQHDDGHINPSYDTLVVSYAADGSTVAKTIYFLDGGGSSQFAGAAGATLYGTGYNDSFRGAAGVSDTFLTGPNGGNDYIANFENGLDHVDLSAFGFTSFAQVDAIATGGTGWTYLSFADGGHLMIAGLSRSSLDASDVIL